MCGLLVTDPVGWYLNVVISASALCPGTQTCCSSTWVAAPASLLQFCLTCCSPAPGQLLCPFHPFTSHCKNPLSVTNAVWVLFFCFSLCSLEQLNVSWCDFNNDHVKSVVHNVSSGITHFNLSGYRESLTLDGKSGMMVPDQPLFGVVVLHIFVHIVFISEQAASSVFKFKYVKRSYSSWCYSRLFSST